MTCNIKTVLAVIRYVINRIFKGLLACFFARTKSLLDSSFLPYPYTITNRKTSKEKTSTHIDITKAKGLLWKIILNNPHCNITSALKYFRWLPQQKYLAYSSFQNRATLCSQEKFKFELT